MARIEDRAMTPLTASDILDVYADLTRRPGRPRTQR